MSDVVRRKSLQQQLGLPDYQEDFTKLCVGRRLVIFGAGGAGQQLSEYLALRGIHLDYYCDNQVTLWGENIAGVEVISPARLVEIADQAVVLVASIHFPAIREQLLGLGINGVFTAYFMTPAHNPIINELSPNRILKLKKTLADEKSVRVLEKILTMRLYPESFYLNDIYSPDKYWPDDIPGFCAAVKGRDGAIIDAGAWDGDTAELFMEAVGGKDRRIYSFEPNASTFAELVANIERSGWKENVQAVQAALYSKNTKRTFDSSRGSASRFAPSTSSTGGSVKAVSLDSFLPDGPVAMIKFDIEGAEPEALEGAAETIRMWQPALAICVYHAVTHLWEIPLWIKELCPDHKIHLRCHSPHLPLEIVCYAYS